MVVQRRTDFLTRLSLDDTPAPNSKTRKLGMPQLLFLAAWPGFLEDTMLGILGGGGEDERVECCLFNRFHSEHGMLGLDPTAVDTRVVKELKEARFAQSGSHLSHTTTTPATFSCPLTPHLSSTFPTLLQGRNSKLSGSGDVLPQTIHHPKPGRKGRTQAWETEAAGVSKSGLFEGLEGLGGITTRKLFQESGTSQEAEGGLADFPLSLHGKGSLDSELGQRPD